MQLKTYSNSIYWAFLLLVACTFSSCRRFLEVPPAPEQQTAEGLFSNEQSAETAVAGIYSEMVTRPNQLTAGYVSLYGALAADEYYYFTPGLMDEFSANEVSELNHGSLQVLFWQPAYRFIHTANMCMEQLENSEQVSSLTKRKLLGEVKVLRAFQYYLLSSFFGAIPLSLTSAYAKNATEGRVPYGLVLEQIKKDLEEAIELLDGVEVSGGKGRVNKGAAIALLVKVAALEKDWETVQRLVTELEASGGYQLMPNLDDVFLKNSLEAIWQLYTVQQQLNTYEGNIILPLNEQTTPTYLLTNWLVASFEEGDLRMQHWIKQRQFAGATLYYPYKFKVRGGTGTYPELECNTPLRYADMLLLRAEATIHLGDLSGGLADLNAVRVRAGLAAIEAGEAEELLEAVLNERRWELFGEWGNRWFDLKRTGRVDGVMSNLKPATWQSTDQLWPIPIGELNLNPNLTQNEGY